MSLRIPALTAALLAASQLAAPDAHAQLWDPLDTKPIPNVIIGLDTSVTMRIRSDCSDCHKDDVLSTPKGPHGSNTDHLLGVQEAGRTQWNSMTRYQTGASTNFCLNCHDLANTNFRNGTRNLHTSMGRHANQPCQTCHVAVPHGWYRYRFLVTTADSAPYKSSKAKINSFTIPARNCAK